ncbi:hypothetical protein EV426DRAFT_4402 [Tirmania nivea]|nr:hypothetical protein EV426DRAFT_4402 [Tirmania nivea]
MRIPGIGTFPDGGLCPGCQMDMLLSIGTIIGSTSLHQSVAETPISPIGFWNHRFVVQIFRSFMNSMDGEKTWSQFHDHLPPNAEQYIRINVQTNPELKLDDLIKMMDLVRMTASSLDVVMYGTTYMRQAFFLS